MKRILIALAMLAAVQVADAQVKTPDVAAKALTKAEAAAKDAKKATKDIFNLENVLLETLEKYKEIAAQK